MKIVSSLISSYFIFKKDNTNPLSPGLNDSWNEANHICNSYNATQPSFSSYNDILDLQALLMEVLDSTLPLPIFVGLQSDCKVSDLIITSLAFFNLSLCEEQCLSLLYILWPV